MESHKADQQFGTVPFLFENVVDCEAKQKNKKNKKLKTQKKPRVKKIKEPQNSMIFPKIHINFCEVHVNPFLILCQMFPLDLGTTKFVAIGFNPATCSPVLLLNDALNHSIVDIKFDAWNIILSNNTNINKYFNATNSDDIQFQCVDTLTLTPICTTQGQKYISFCEPKSTNCVLICYEEYQRIYMLSEYINSQIFYFNSISHSIVDYITHYMSTCQTKNLKWLNSNDYSLPEKLDGRIPLTQYIRLFTEMGIYASQVGEVKMKQFPQHITNNNNNNNNNNLMCLPVFNSVFDYIE